MKCMLADDNRVNQIIGSRMLKKLGHRAVVVSNGREAIDGILVNRYDVIFMDCQMPIMDGFEATKAIRHLPRDHMNFNIPVIALTGHDSEFNLMECILCGMNSRLSKPVNAEDLAELLKRLVPQVLARQEKYKERQDHPESVMP